MSEFDWEKPGKHPPLPILLLHLERELGNREAAAVERHTAQCWECRTECDRLQRGICGFIEHRNQVLIPALPPPPPTRGRFLRRLQAEAAKPVSWPAGVLRFLRAYGSRRLPWAVATALATLAAFMIAPKFLSPPLGGPPAVSAAEFLQLARTSTSPLAPGSRSFIYQKVEIRHGGRVFQREILRGRNRTSTPVPPADVPLLPPVDWSDPLGPDQFATWRDGLQGKRDSIEENGNLVTLSTAPLKPEAIESASLTVRRSDWHTIAKKVDLAEGQSIEIREVAYELRPSLEPPAVAAAPRFEEPSASLDPPPSPDPAVSEAQMEEAEVDLREALHRAGADVQEAPRIWREGDSIRFSAWVEDERRAAKLRQAAAADPRVKAEIHLPGVAPGNQAALPASAAGLSEPAAVTHPPLAEQLWKKMGGLDAANQYLGELGQAHVDLLAAASSLARLAERYPESERDRLAAPTWLRVERLAAEQIVSVRELSQRYLGSLSPVLSEMMSNQGIAAIPGPDARGCAAWQALAPAIAADSRLLQQSFRRMFVQEQVDRPVSFGAADLLRQSDAARASLAGHVRRLCAPVSAAR